MTIARFVKPLLFSFYSSWIVLGLFGCSQDNIPEEHPTVGIVAPKSAIGNKENPRKRFEFEYSQVVDPATGKLPKGIYKRELVFSAQLPKMDRAKGNFRLNEEDWAGTGPSNVGGRTRAVAMDIRNEDVLIAGGVSGGMWRSEDAGTLWEKTTHPSALSSATSVVQDRRIGKQDIWYHGTGELVGNSVRSPGAPYRGDGIFKSLDNGKSWNQLASTATGEAELFNDPFQYVWDIVVNTKRMDVDEIFAAIYGGIVRSQDGGETWETVLGVDLLNGQVMDLNESGAPFYTSLVITPQGVLYATLSTFTSKGHVTGDRGIFKSVDGETWDNITPSGFIENYNRIVVAVAPSNNAIIYSLVNADDGVNELWKMDGFWKNRSNNIPGVSDTLAAYDAQESYNMSLHVHPNDENVVFLGGTNLYRSDDGFETSSATIKIGGYGEENGFYPNHHPDHHNLLFYPSEPDMMLSTTDGGIHLTFNNLANEVKWSSRNREFVTSQFYSIAMSKEADNPLVIGGLQDNGTQLRGGSNTSTSWDQLIGGDGGFCEILPNRTVMYSSFQEGQIYRLHVNESYEFVGYARVDPSGVDREKFLFVTPFVFDPNNYSRMYLAVGDVVYRNDNLNQIPGGKQDPTPVNWKELLFSKSNEQQISALDVSTQPRNVLYYGTSEGKIYRMDSADRENPKSEHVLTQLGYVGNITIDPSDADHALFVYTNYNVQSVFATTDGGKSVVAISGNLEEKSDGTGGGSSVRWSLIVPLTDGTNQYFVGTSTGLYSTQKLEGMSTVWVKEGEKSIGNAVIKMMKYRSSDGKMYIATHGNGIYSTNIANTEEIQADVAQVDKLTIATGYPNPFDEQFTLKFTIPETAAVSVYVNTISGQTIKKLLDATQEKGEVVVNWDGANASGTPMINGLYTYRIYYQGQSYAGKMVLTK